MRNLKFILIACLFVFQANGYGQEESEVATTSNDSNETGTICFIRKTGFYGSAAAFKTFIDEEFVCKLNNKRYSMHEVAPGSHIVSVQFGGKKSKEKAEKFQIDVNPGQITYVQIVMETGAFVNNIYCEEITEKTAKRKMESLKVDKKCK
ncbi:uncharacterized protein DUF2846 [Winogradskyella wandonensis]|uniref:Uncharacterized protein DUF2846 n=1 Tax=Winogradskyella wandonensis TaxID=1442586 RepID=A0A4R1KUZ2_9FLAO|nr:DUF2846 domain-containing protein [Winogradskyella wandonensis]TCK68954.1 uncharacterized protein DUF2846 [Winogradskyella wandonensis]